MADDLFEFRWTVPVGGFCWTSRPGSEGRSERVLALRDKRFSAEERTYLPLIDAPALFRNFAEIPPDDQDAILQFANKWGTIQHDSSRNRPGLFGFQSETLAEWTEAIQYLSSALELSRMIQEDDEAGLSRFMRWWPEIPPEITVEFSEDDYSRLPASWDFFDPRFRDSRGEAFRLASIRATWPATEDRLLPATRALEQLVNRNLSASTSPRLIFTPEPDERSPGPDESRHFRIQIVPDTLLSAMWLQFARTLEGHRRQRACKSCGLWFEISKAEHGFRKNREFCSDACKSRDYRKALATARELKSQGLSATQIARQMGKDVKTVRNWLEKTKTKRRRRD